MCIMDYSHHMLPAKYLNCIRMKMGDANFHQTHTLTLIKHINGNICTPCHSCSYPVSHHVAAVQWIKSWIYRLRSSGNVHIKTVILETLTMALGVSAHRAAYYWIHPYIFYCAYSLGSRRTWSVFQGASGTRWKSQQRCHSQSPWDHISLHSEVWCEH